MNYVRFDNRTPRPMRGWSLEEMMINCRSLDKSEEEIEREKVKWAKHHPPMGVEGVYAFIDRPYNIRNSICWPGYAWNVAHEEAEKIAAKMMKEGAPLMACEPLTIIATQNRKLKTAYHYSEEDVEVVWCHFMLNDGHDLFDEELSEWIPVRPERVNEMDDELLDALEEVFLELKK